MDIFENFDFSVLDLPHYKEDAVREDIVSPILKKLGYAPSGKNKMIRSQPLTHPFVYIGTKSNKVNIIPDYLLQVEDVYVFTLDAKAPNEDIRKGANVEQAFSYSIHPDVRTFLYGLCNGREICIYTWSKREAILIIPTSELDKRWTELEEIISPNTFVFPQENSFLPDYGLSLLKMDINKNIDLYFYSIWVDLIVKIDDDTYSFTSGVGSEEEPYLASFDFSKELYGSFVDCVPQAIKSKIVTSLKQQPYKIELMEKERFEIIVKAKLGKIIHTNENEEYLPLEVLELTSC